MRIDVFHDTVCPWCRIGKQHLKLAIEQWDGEPVTVYYHTFFLNADVPAEGYDFRSYLQAKSGGRVPLEEWFTPPTEAGKRVGLTFNFEKIERAPNTSLSHQLIALTPDDQQVAMIDHIYAAYFEQGRDIGQIDVLVDIAAANGLDGESIREELEQEVASDVVLADAAQAAHVGITGVPFFIINNLLAFSGAQPPEVMLQAMQQAADMAKKPTV